MQGPRRDWGMQDGDRLVITGSLPQLGNWQPRQPLAMVEVATPHWEAEVRGRRNVERSAYLPEAKGC